MSEEAESLTVDKGIYLLRARFALWHKRYELEFTLLLGEMG